MSLREQILSGTELKRSTVNIPEWNNVTLTIQELDGENRMKLYELCIEDKKMNYRKMSAAVAVLSVIDPETGKRVFTDDDIVPLWEKSGKACERLSAAAMKLSSLGPYDMEEAEKN